MISFETRFLTRLLIYGLAILFMSGSLIYSRYLANKLEEKERRDVQLYADAIKLIADPNLSEENPEEAYQTYFNFIVTRLMGENDQLVPLILVGEDGEIGEMGVQNLKLSEDERKQRAQIQKYIREFEATNGVIDIEFAPGRFQQIYYGESFLLKQLRWFPFAQLLLAFVFIGVVFAGFAIAKRNEQNKVWVGLAKETAHQLGTPVSSLMAWIEFLKLRMESRPEEQELINEMERDIKRLEDIAERFSKIGSKPELVEVSLKEVLDRSANYIKKRMTQRGSIQLHLHNNIPLDSKLHINPQLFDWVIENLLKNALDAIKSKEGSITIEAGEKGGNYFIDVTDTGKGIAKSHFKKVFEPGFTTKKRGWGLGLSLTKRIVENYHKGKIFVKSSELGKGTTFRILLPRHD
ncbi:MAG: GHKL domain-containing protein [Bacteroidetes bacterium]|nr:MAG: GHKL domain-containing protein [Bacteroidota bacterium]